MKKSTNTKKESNGNKDVRDRPHNNQVEVSLFGPGYGECVLIHLGFNNWIIVDSCINFKTKEPAAIKYLHELNLNPSDCVKLIVATHWHDDHIRGLSKIVEQCKSAEFVCSDALSTDDFLRLALSYGNYSMMESTGVNEFSRILEILQERGLSRKFAIAERNLYKHKIRGEKRKSECNIVSLSPSDKSVLLSRLEIAKLLPQKNKTKLRILTQRPNHSSVVITIKIDDLILLLGSDLEVSGDEETGWQVIISKINNKYGRASYFKIPHHGSESSHSDDVWQEMLKAEPLAVLTPFRRGDVLLPQKKDIDRILKHTSEAYITAKQKYKSSRKDNMVEKTIRETVIEIHEIDNSIGHIRYRNDIFKNNSKGEIELFGSACRLDELK